ncbi:MAG TPA: NAD-dependent epimerase/dehydratase family protein [bacterium]|jgi:UDP-glucose 4-epimerase|nr:NAD-dependent epimerase/dehydratase family protein [bacterium]HNT65127.1 NAD-dependent epimerase/dehydratase family protein [bacterium]HOX86345.1 NAD-dependent epimerase/dehydratase family protein [bacterium]HPG45826.1 NAD-dependent epimerase/dehydratase family protein [bacterium]HPM97947.1 NAD-dependent epimerase/dehydratase family protein [bacterium]
MPNRELLPAAYRGKKVLITGGLGFIGSHLAARLVDYGADVLIVDSLIPQYGGNWFNVKDIRDRVTINIADIRDQYGMNYLVQGKDYIFNLAGQVSHIDSMEDPFTDLEINCKSQLSILEACRNFNSNVKIVFAGTRQQYGKPNYLPVDEKHPQNPTDVNGINKMAGEWYHILYNNIYGIRASSLRLTNTYGPHLLMKHNRQGFMTVFIRKLIDGEEIEIFGDGNQIRDFIYVQDVVDAFLLVGAFDECNGQIYNLGGDEPLKLLDLVKLMIDIYGKGTYHLVPFPENKKRIDIGNYYADYRKIRAALGWKYRTPMRQGLETTLTFYQQYKDQYWT